MTEFIKRIISAISGSYFGQFISKLFVRLRVAITNPFRRIYRKIQQLFNLNVVSSKLVSPLAAKVRKIMKGEAKSPEDYITIGNLWISRMLIYLIILALCAFVFIYFTLINPASTSNTTTTESITTSVYYDYDDMDLAEYSGKANIRGESGSIVYTGDIVSGICTGTGRVWNQDGTLVYDGEINANKFSGKGTKYYANGKAQYEGEFSENNFDGSGKLYYSDGTLEYEGSFSGGSFSGEGVLYDERGNLIYEGEFLGGVYHGTGTSYYTSGTKQYVGEFYQGKRQGTGTLYSAAGKIIYSGAFARNEIRYESLVGASLEDVLNATDETPVIYYSDNSLCYVLKNAGIILLTDSRLQMLKRDTDSDDETTWYLEQEDGSTLTETSDSSNEEENSDKSDEISAQNSSSWDEKNSTSDDLAAQIAELPSLNSYSPWFYIEKSDSWVSESELDDIRESGKSSGITVKQVAVCSGDIDLSFLSDCEYEAKNGAADLLQCCSIEQLRQDTPTLFSAISYRLTAQNDYYTYLDGINLADALYEEVYEADGIKYHLFYEMSDPETLRFVTFEAQ